jgi:hypothetical protein
MSAGTSSQELAHRHNYACQSVPVKQYLQEELKVKKKEMDVLGVEVNPNRYCKSQSVEKRL